MKLSSKAYDILKWSVCIVIPSLTTAYVSLAGVWGFPCPEQIAKTSSIICTLIGALIGISTAQYNKDAHTTEEISEE